MIVWGEFIELTDFYTQYPMLIRAGLIVEVGICGDATYISFAGKRDVLVEEDYETVKGLLGQIYGKKG